MKIFIDLGASLGKATDIAIDKYPDFDRFLLFEPAPELYAKLKEKYLNNLYVRVFCFAVSNKEKFQKLYFPVAGTPNPEDSATLMVDKTNANKDDYVRVETVDFAKLLKQFDPTDTILLKVDIEGAEYDLLNTYARLLKS